MTFGDEEELSRNVSWQYDSVVSLNSFVELVDTLAKDTFCIQAEGEEFQSRSGKAAYYVAKLRALRPDTYYRYRVSNAGRYSVWFSFRTYNQATRKDYSFMYVGDVQDSINGKAGEYLKRALAAHPKTEFFGFWRRFDRASDGYVLAGNLFRLGLNRSALSGIERNG
ncbi:MAG: fibronectin type III domain-containing protein [Phocaeicola sp.]